jgi:hypothetical protein
MTKADRIGVVTVLAVFLAVVAFALIYTVAGHPGQCRNAETGRWSACGQRHDG